jgi:hypothetical protein
MSRGIALGLMLAGVLLWNLGGCASGGGGGGGGGRPDNVNANTPVDNTNANTPPANDNTNDNGPVDNTNDNTPTDHRSALIKTHIDIGDYPSSARRIEAGDDLVVFATNEGIFYFVASTADADLESATEIPNSAALFGNHNWKVVGKKIALVRSTNAVSIFDTQTGALVDISAGDISLDPFVQPSDPYKPGHMTSDGALIATINDASDSSSVNDGNAIKVIDVSGSTPQIISFPTPEAFSGAFDQVAIDAETRQVAAHGDNPDDLVYVFDIDNPAAAPQVFDFFDREGFGDQVQMQFDGAHILYHVRFENRSAFLNLADDTLIRFPVNQEFDPTSPLALQGGSFGYFLAAESADSISAANGVVWRSAIGPVSGAPNATLATQLDYVDTSGDTPEFYGEYGYGSTLAITPDGARWFIAGEGPIDDNSDLLQMSAGGRFNVFTDPDGDTATGRVQATDVSCSANTVAFWVLRQTNLDGAFPEDHWVPGFIVLERLAE